MKALLSNLGSLRSGLLASVVGALFPACDTEGPETLLYGKACQVGNCVEGFSCHPKTQRCVTDADATRLQAAGDWEDEAVGAEAGVGASLSEPGHPTAPPGPASPGPASPGPASPGPGAPGSGGAASTPVDPAPPGPGVAGSGGVAPAPADAGTEAEPNPQTGALPDRTLTCGLSTSQTCDGSQVCCIVHVRTDKCIAPDAECDCNTGCDIARCSKADDCPGAQICCYERETDPGESRCTTAQDCEGAEMCDPNQENCDGRCTYEKLLNRECAGQRGFSTRR